MICVLSVPPTMAPAEFCQFMNPYAQGVRCTCGTLLHAGRMISRVAWLE